MNPRDGFLQRRYFLLLLSRQLSLRFNQLALLLDLRLLLFDSVEHGPEDWIVVDYQIPVACLTYCFGNHFLYCLRTEPDVFSVGFQLQCVVRFVFVAEWLQTHQRLQTGSEMTSDVFQSFIGK